MKKTLYTIIVLSILLFALKASSETSYSYLDKIKKISISSKIYNLEQKEDFFTDKQCPSKSFNVVPIDLNSDGQNELFVSNPDNNGNFFYFWRIYRNDGRSYKKIGQMACTDIRISSKHSDNYKEIECYNYLSLVEGRLKTYKHFGDEYISDSESKIRSSAFYQN